MASFLIRYTIFPKCWLPLLAIPLFQLVRFVVLHISQSTADCYPVSLTPFRGLACSCFVSHWIHLQTWACKWAAQAGTPSGDAAFQGLLNLLGMCCSSFLITLVFILQCPTYLSYSLPRFLEHAELSLVDRTKDKPSAPCIIFLVLAKVKATKANQRKPCLMFGRITVTTRFPLYLEWNFQYFNTSLCWVLLTPAFARCFSH